MGPNERGKGEVSRKSVSRYRNLKLKPLSSKKSVKFKCPKLLKKIAMKNRCLDASSPA